MAILTRAGVVLFLLFLAVRPVQADPVTSAETPKPALPSPALFMYGYGDAQTENPQTAALWRKLFGTFNIIEGTTTNADFVKRLRADGKVFAHHVVNTFEETATVDDIVAAWSAPFRNDLDGELPGGFDAIAVDELHSNPDGTPESKRVVAALRQLRERYPNKLILVSCVWKLAFSGHKRRDGIFYGDGDYSQRVENPSFEEAGGWEKSPGTSTVLYADVPDLPDYHAAKFATHEKRAARMVRGPKSSELSQVVTIEPGTTYCLSAWATGADAKTAFNAGLKVADAGGSSHFEASEDFHNIPPQGPGPKRWQRFSLTFTIPAGTQQVKIILHDAPAAPGAVLYWDFVELEERHNQRQPND